MSDELCGSWTKVGGGECAAAYPDHLELRPGGRFTGRSEPDARLHPLWDIGGYRVVGPGRIRLSTSYGADVEYAFELVTDRLRFTDPESCRFEYRRAGHGAAA